MTHTTGEVGHTPGPWEAETLDPCARENERPWVGLLGEKRYVALACGDTQAEAVANARLLAATLDLLKAAKMLASLDSGKGKGRSFPTQEQCDFACAAIARTEARHD